MTLSNLGVGALWSSLLQCPPCLLQPTFGNRHPSAQISRGGKYSNKGKAVLACVFSGAGAGPLDT